MELELTLKTERLLYALLVAQIVPLEFALNVLQAMSLNLMQLFASLALVDVLYAMLQILKSAVTAIMVIFCKEIPALAVIQNAFHVLLLLLLVYNANMVNIFLWEILAKNVQLTVTAVQLLDVMFAGKASQKISMANAKDALFFVQVVIIVILQLALLVQLAFSSLTLSVSHALINVKSAMETAACNVRLDTILTQLENVFSTASYHVLHALIISHQSVLLASELQFCQEENAILTRIVTKQVLALIVELDSTSSYSKVNAIHAHLLQISMAASNAARQINNFAVFVKEAIISKSKEAVLNALIVA